MAQAAAETLAYVDRARALIPTGTVPPFVMRFDAGGVPVGDLVFSSKTKTVAELQDAALFRVRPLFAILPGVSAPPPFGSSQRTILVRLHRGKLRSYNMSPDKVVRGSAGSNDALFRVCSPWRMAKMAGKMINVAMVPPVRPPITARPSGAV
jgi:multidrug efflux pump subunit AcrB